MPYEINTAEEPPEPDVGSERNPSNEDTYEDTDDNPNSIVQI